MGALGSFGDIEFEVSITNNVKKIMSFRDFRRDTSSIYENHQLIGQKPRTEFIAPGLDTVSFTVLLNAQHGVSPRDEMNRWIEYARSGNAERLEIGGKALGVDRWIVTSVSQAWDTIFSQGELISGKVDVALQEYVSTIWTIKGYQDGLKKQAEKRAARVAQGSVAGNGTSQFGVQAKNDDWELLDTDIIQALDIGSASEIPSDRGFDYLGIFEKSEELSKQIEEIRLNKARKLSAFYNVLYKASSTTIWGNDVWKRTLGGADIVNYVQERGISVKSKKDYSKIVGTSIDTVYGVDTLTEYFFYKESTSNPLPYEAFMNICGPYWHEDSKTLWKPLATDTLGVLASIISVGSIGYYMLSNVKISWINVNITKTNWGGIQYNEYGTIYAIPSVSTSIAISFPAIDISGLTTVQIEQLTFAIANNGISGLPPSGGGSENLVTLPNFGNAKIDSKKITEYVLNPEHPVGGNKAKVFNSALGYNKSNASSLIEQIRKQLPNSKAIMGLKDQYGQRFTVDMSIVGANGKTETIRTGWIIDSNSSVPRLITLFVK